MSSSPRCLVMVSRRGRKARGLGPRPHRARLGRADATSGLQVHSGGRRYSRRPRTDSQPSVRTLPVATNARADARYPLPQAVPRSPFFRELESMIGRSALRVAKQHGHSIATMLRVYAAWTEGAMEASLDAIERAMAAAPRTITRVAAMLNSTPPSGHISASTPPKGGRWRRTSLLRARLLAICPLCAQDACNSPRPNSPQCSRHC